MPNFIKNFSCTFLLLALYPITYSSASELVYDPKIFSSNPYSIGLGFYFNLDTVEGKTTKIYPKSCNEFYNLWENNKNSFGLNVYYDDHPIFMNNLGKCVISKWIDLSKINMKDNIINKSPRAKITTLLPAAMAISISCERYEIVNTADRQGKSLKDIWTTTWPEAKLSKKQIGPKNIIYFNGLDGESFSIIFYGSVTDPVLNKVYPVQTSYSVGYQGRYKVEISYLLRENKNGTFNVVKHFPAESDVCASRKHQ